jgi:hypothetical protein
MRSVPQTYVCGTVGEPKTAQISYGAQTNIGRRSSCDRNIQYRQNPAHRKISLVFLGSNIRPSIEPKIARIAAALKRVSPGSFEFIEIAPPPKRRRLRDPPPDGTFSPNEKSLVDVGQNLLTVASPFGSQARATAFCRPGDSAPKSPSIAKQRPNRPNDDRNGAMYFPK